MNIKFNYLYRDGSNYKKWADVVFSNEDGVTTNAVTQNLHNAFLPDGLFVAHQVRIPEVFLWSDDQLDPDDHCFHEFASVEPTSDTPNGAHGRSIREFIAEVTGEGLHQWPAFNPQDRLLQRNR
jgi:hypothetical protein